MTSPHLSRQYASQLLFEVYSSKKLKTIILVIFTIVSFAALSIDSGFIIFNITIVLLLSFFTRRALKNNGYRQLQWRADGQWLICQGHSLWNADLQQGSVVMPGFAILNFKLESRKSLSVLLFKDNIDKEKFRQLRVRLKVEGITPGFTVDRIKMK